MTTDADLRAYLDAHGADGAPTRGWHVVDAMVEGRRVTTVAFVKDGYAWCSPGFAAADILRHAPLRLAAPDLPCGHPAVCVRPTDGHAGTTRWCGWCEAEGEVGRLREAVAAAKRGVDDSAITCAMMRRERDEARDEVAAAIAESARLATLLDETCQRYNATLDRVMSERDVLRAQVTQMKVATIEALAPHARAAVDCEPANATDIIGDVCEAVGIDREAPYREGGR